MKPAIDQLRSLLKPISREYLGCSMLDAGIARGSITEVSGNGKTEFSARFLLEHRSLKAAWIEENFSVNPCGLQQRNIDPAQILFIESGKNVEWTVLQVARSNVFPIIVLYSDFSDLRAMRRMQIALEKSNTALLWLTPHPKSFWTTSLQLEVYRHQKNLEVSILKQRFA